MGAELQYIDQASLPPTAARACIVDVETTGLHPTTDEVIEVGLVLFAFDRDTGEVLGILDEYGGQREPTCPISREATAVHGLTRKMLKGKRLDYDRIESILSQADFLIAHNARFDYSFFVRLVESAREKPWLCSMNGIPWYRHGFSSKGLQHLLRAHQIRVTQAHRATADARATLALLACRSEDGTFYLAELMTSPPIHKPTKRTAKTRDPKEAPRSRENPAGCGTAVAGLFVLFVLTTALLLYHG